MSIGTMMASYREQARRTGLGRVIVGLMRRRLNVGMMTARDAARIIKIGLSPADYLRRRSLAAKRQTDFNLSQLNRDGYLFVGRDAIPNTAGLVKHCVALFERKKNALLAAYTPPYALAIKFENTERGLVAEEPSELTPILEFCLQPKVIDLLSSYIGEMPVIGDVSLMYTMPGMDKIGSQRFHRDVNQPRQLHMLVPLYDIDEKTGPFTLIPRPATQQIITRLGHVNERVEDADIEAVVQKEDFVRCTGRAGDIYFANAHDCFHFGARCEEKPRLMLIVNFTSRFEGLEGTMAVYRSANRAKIGDTSPEARLLLGL